MGTSPMIIQGPSAVRQSRGFSVSLCAHISFGGLIFQGQQEDIDQFNWISVTKRGAVQLIVAAPVFLMAAITPSGLPTPRLELSKFAADPGAFDIAVQAICASCTTEPKHCFGVIPRHLQSSVSGVSILTAWWPLN